MIQSTWKFWSGIPYIGKWVFSWLVAFVAPYTGTLPLRFQTITTEECITTTYDWFWIRNPFKSIHAAALTNIGEATMGVAALTWGEEHNCRAIPTRLEIDFYKKARGTLKGVCKLPFPMLDGADTIGDAQLVTFIYDQQGDLVCIVTGNWRVSRNQEKKIK
jgi:acyl-coenzyme A thioesterase PaaI-like protein